MTIKSVLLVNSDRLNHSIDRLAEIGERPNGGVRRIAYSTEDLQARQLIKIWMTQAGMTVRIDTAGNMIATYPGQIQKAAALATGSHIDTVPLGGRYDGTLGVLAGIEVVRVLQENNIKLIHPLEVIVFTDEESSMIGSKAMSGNTIKDTEYYHRDDRTSIKTCLERIGGNWNQLSTARRSQSEIAAYIELHVEQGGVLENVDKQIGVVQGIVGQHRYAISVTGSPNHAGTTPMHMRRDALVAAAQVVLAVNNLGNKNSGSQVATVGSFNVWPNAANIVPGKVEMSLDIRDIYQSHIDELVGQLKQELSVIADSSKTQIAIERTLRVEPTLAKPQIKDAIASACQQLQLSYYHLPSRAGHDAQEIGRFTDMGMIFVPSVAGISHSELEYTSPEQCSQGANVLLQTLLQLDKMYPV
ncbi:Zn-dependent hydrolase [Argonema galeatum]|uniref:Zn-dependent hydrolase n=1 Tax=Argonema galeatum TaxID=2942762 RepID=UPI002012DB05|nr:Zn-dependent hydrolase [Argonema galeatum]MCL1463233.1 Zn-dependent hydrolase [Argonema galeatum A003/A1]